MEIKDKIKEFEKLFKKINPLNITSIGKNHNGLDAGSSGETKVFNILEKYCETIYPGVVIWNENHDMLTEVDFVCKLNGFILFVETKEWYGNVRKSEDPNKVLVSFKNIKGIFYENIRTSPTYALGCFTRDFLKFNNLKMRGSSPQIKRIVVFTRDELKIIDELSSSNIEVCYLKEFESKLIELSTIDNPTPISIPVELPSWDYYYDAVEKCWYKFVIKNMTISGLEVSSLKSMLINDERSAAYFVLKDNTILYRPIDYEEIKVNTKSKYLSKRISFIKFDDILHTI